MLRAPVFAGSGLALALAAACAPTTPCARCETLVIAATGEPDHLLPPFVWQSVGRDINDLVYERLAVLEPSRSPLDTGAYRPGLASSWERVDSVTWRFHLRSGAEWHDGQPVTAQDVVYSFEAHQDSTIDAMGRSALTDMQVAAEDDRTVRIAFASSRPDQLYDATWHVRIFPEHVWDSIPRDRWGAASEAGRLIGSGPFKVVEWRKGELLTLEAVGTASPIRRVMWQFAQGPEVLGNLALAGDADLVETAPDPARMPAYRDAPHLKVVSYPAAVYGYLGFNFGRRGPWRDVAVRRALELALDRSALVEAVIGPGTQVPDGPLSGQSWLHEATLPAALDTVAAAHLLDSLGWSREGRGMRRQLGNPLTVDILVPGTSAMRRNLAVTIQERWRRIGVEATVTVVDFPVFQERLGQGRFDTYIGSWLDEPHARSLADQWTRRGIGGQNYGRYDNPAFDSLFTLAMTQPDTARARELWRASLERLNADVPAIWLFTPQSQALVHRRVQVTGFQPFAWLADLPKWEISNPGAP